MTAGLPGSGIGGFFYLLCALLMPLYECGLIVLGRRHKSRWRFVIKQVVCALAILISIWLTGFLIGLLVKGVVKAAAIQSSARLLQSFKIEAFSIMLVSLLVVMCIIELVAGVMILKRNMAKQS